VVFTLSRRPVGWEADAPVVVERAIALACAAPDAFHVLADHDEWTTWFGGMRRVRVDGPASGVGARRTVWVGLSRVTEEFVVWEPGRRLVFDIVASNLPGLDAMTEVWSLTPVTDASCRLDVVVAVAPKGPLRRAPALVRWVIARATRGAAGIEARCASIRGA
jgi:hypothetical protein